VNKYFITGGAGFIGSHLCEEIFFSDINSKIYILDKLTYAGNIAYLQKIIHSKRVKFIKGDIADSSKYIRYLSDCKVAINVAAESHVDNSFQTPIPFTITNTLGAHIFIQNCINQKVNKIIHISSDEVYGEKVRGKSKEEDILNPTNPYSASKAAAEIIINSYKFAYKDEIIIVRANNVYGIRQYPEKLISSCIVNLIRNKPIKLHGDGSNSRFYLSAVDFAKAVYLLSKKKKNGIYNIGSKNEYKNLEIAKLLCDHFNKSYKKFINFVTDRPYNDKRYSVSFNKIQKLGWSAQHKLIDDIPYIIDWYKKNYRIFKKY
jgi:UDP-glucose 4,6-dehydratase